MLTALIVIPLLASIVTMLLPKDNHNLIRRFALGATLLPFIIVLFMWPNMDFSGGMQFQQVAQWIPSIGVGYHIGVDGISFPMLLVTGLVSVLSVVAAFNIENRVKDFFALMLLLQMAMYGVFIALDYVLFFVFWELLLVPMYFLIGIWGGPRREYAAIKFFIYTLVGSAIMLVGILATYLTSGLGTFNILEIAEKASFAPQFQWFAFLAFFIGFAVKVPIFPFHTWLPDAHVEAPTSGSMILAGVLLKTGTYGFFRIAFPTFPEAAKAFAPMLAVLAVISIIYGALAAMAQRDVKRLVAYSSVSHMGFVILGLAAATPMAMNGALYVMVSHGIISPLMFYYVGSVFYERTHTRMMDDMGGLFVKMPVAATIFAVSAFANLGLPGLSGFIGEFFTFVGAFSEFLVIVIIAALGLAITAGYHLWMMQRTLMGEPKNDQVYADLTTRELVVSTPLVALTILLGVTPAFVLNMFNSAVTTLVKVLG